MASVFAHGLAAWTLGRAYTRGSMTKRFCFLTVACACLPDADVFAFAFGIPYGAMLGHRGLSHSLFFALAVGAFVATIFFREHRFGTPEWTKLTGFFALATASHGLLDAFTDGGLGIALLSPLDLTRYFFPFRPIAVSPIGVEAFFSERGLRVLLSEAIWIGIPCLLLLLLSEARRKSEFKA